MRSNVLTYLEDAMERKPHKMAFSDGKNQLSFQELGDLSQQVGSYLAKTGIRRKPIVIFMQKSPQTLAAFFGTIYSGNYYVPLDSEMPQHRISLILESLQAELVIAEEKTEKIAKSFCNPEKVKLFSEISSCAKEQNLLCQLRETAIDIDPIYMIFTSGSTGVPKGVLANHRSVIDYVEQLSKVLEVGENTIFGNQSPLYVDACLKEIFPTLKFCASTYFIPKSLFMFPVKLIDYLNEHKINCICWVVTALTIISSLGGLEAKKLLHLRTIAFGSEIFPMKQFRLWREHLPQAKFIHLYGPTEATGMSTFYVVPADFSLEQEKIPIGKPFPNTEIQLLGEDLQAVAQGEQGEICIRGTCLTMGYYNDKEKTNSSFIQNPQVSAYVDLLYRTGDLGQYNARGELCYIARKDQQIKHLGHRIELAEIEMASTAVPGISLSCCVYHKEEKLLLLYYVGDISPEELQKVLKSRLPRYMLPGKLLALSEMPLTPNGKINRNFLLEQAISPEKGELL